MIHLYSKEAKIVKAVRDAAAGHVPVTVSAPAYRDLPKRARFIATTSALNVRLERFGAARAAMVVVLPEAGDYIILTYNRAPELPVTIIGSDYLRV